jgi:hypothetical protein
VNPKLTSESDVRMTAISVRSALMRVRCTARPVFREANSNEIELGLDFDVTCSSDMTTTLTELCGARSCC